MTERPQLAALADLLAARVRAHRVMEPAEEQRLEASVRARTADLLDSWWKVATQKQEAGARLVYQQHEGQDGPPLLHAPLDPELANLGSDARKFKAPRSLRDVEPPVNLWVTRLDGVEVALPAEGDEA